MLLWTALPGAASFCNACPQELADNELIRATPIFASAPARNEGNAKRKSYTDVNAYITQLSSY